MATRKYESELRVEQARLTRRRILDAAERLLLERGYGEMTVAALADGAIETPDDLTVVFHLNQPDQTFMKILSSATTSMATIS